MSFKSSETDPHDIELMRKELDALRKMFFALLAELRARDLIEKRPDGALWTYALPAWRPKD